MLVEPTIRNAKSRLKAARGDRSRLQNKCLLRCGTSIPGSFGIVKTEIGRGIAVVDHISREIADSKNIGNENGGRGGKSSPEAFWTSGERLRYPA